MFTVVCTPMKRCQDLSQKWWYYSAKASLNAPQVLIANKHIYPQPFLGHLVTSVKRVTGNGRFKKVIDPLMKLSEQFIRFSLRCHLSGNMAYYAVKGANKTLTPHLLPSVGNIKVELTLLPSNGFSYRILTWLLKLPHWITKWNRNVLPRSITLISQHWLMWHTFHLN